MRFIIIGLSILFFTLSAIITFKALGLPVHKISYQDYRKDVTSESNNVIKKLTEDQDTNKVHVADLQATIAQLEDKLKTKEEARESIKATDKDVTSESINAIKKLTEDQDINKARVADMQATIAQLEDKLKTKEEALESIKTTEVENMPRTLTVFGGWAFPSGQDAIHDIAFSTIENFIKEISASPGSRVIIEGHTDNIPTGKQHSDNFDLSLRRARAVANILVSHGISPDRISVIGYGDAHPIDSNDTEEGRAKNRRVEVKLMPKEGKN
jgi:outer membrane protein OmpA-like peptidoglycan-associated protein